MAVIIGDCKLIPAPLVAINEDIVTTPDGRKIGTVYTLTLTGTIVTDKGSPQDGGVAGAFWGGPNGLFWTGPDYPADDLTNIFSKQNSIQIKQDAIRALFSTDGQWVQFQSPNGDAPLKCQTRLKSIQFENGVWVNTCNYTITLEADILYLNGAPVNNQGHSELISSSSESWQIQEGDVKKTYSVTHTVSAVGKRTFDSTGAESGYPWQRAKDFVANRLGLGYTSTGSFSLIPGQSIVNSSALASGTINFANLSPHNFSRNETVDEDAGSYALTESWLLGASSGTDIYTINIKRLSEDPYTTIVASIQGKITGFYDNLFDYDQRIQNAQWMWSQLQGNALFNRVLSVVGTGINSIPNGATLDIDTINGTIDYNYVYDNKPFNGDVLDTFVISRKNTADDYKVTYSINGTIKGRKYEGDIDPKQAYIRAKTYFDSLDEETFFYNRIVSPTYFPEASSIGLRLNPLSKNVDLNEAEGSISYAYDLNNRLNDGDISSDYVQEDYTVNSSFNATDGKRTYTINGTIIGLAIADATRESRYNNAINYWDSVAKPNVYSRIQAYYSGVSIPNNNPISIEIQKNKNSAQLTYAYTFNNQPAPLLPGALFENINVSEQNANRTVQTVARIPIIGRSTGPIIQQMSTTTERQRNLSIEVFLGPISSGTLLDSFNAKPNYDTYVSQLAPDGGFIQDDNESWSWRDGHYTRNVTWIH
jgi:hypothetical protein